MKDTIGNQTQIFHNLFKSVSSPVYLLRQQEEQGT